MKMISALLLLLTISAFSCKAPEDQVPGKDGSHAETGEKAEDLLTTDDRGASVELDAPVPLVYRFSSDDAFGFVFSSIQHVRMFRDSVEDENNYQELRHWYRFEVLEAGPNGGGLLRATSAPTASA